MRDHDLRDALRRLSGVAQTSETETASGTSVGSAIAVFLGSFAIILREGLEAILIVGAIIAYLVKTGNKKGVVPVYIGSALGVVCSFIMAGILNYLLARSAEYHMSQEVIEGIAALTAVVVLFWVSNWMVSKSESAAWSQYIENQVASGADRGSMFALAFTAWLAVFREGAEVILFYQPMLREDRPEMVWAGFGVGVLALFVTLGIPALAYVDFPTLFGAVDAVSRASMELPEQPSGNFVILLNRTRHNGTAEDWVTFFSGGETDVIMDDVACLAAQGDATGVQLAERFRSRLVENQMSVRTINPTLLASRADAGVYDVVIVSAEMADALALSTAYECAETAVITVRGDAT